MKIYKEGKRSSIYAFSIVLVFTITLFMILNNDSYSYSDADRIFFSQFIIVGGAIISVLLTAFVWLSRKSFIIDTQGLTIKSGFSTSFFDWGSIKSISTISSRYDFYHEVLTDKRRIDIPLFNGDESLIQNIIDHANLETHETGELLGRKYRRWKRKGHEYEKTSSRDSLMNYIYK